MAHLFLKKIISLKKQEKILTGVGAKAPALAWLDVETFTGTNTRQFNSQMIQFTNDSIHK